MNYIQRVHAITKRIPEGRVTTYGAISKVTGINPRMVGWALHANRDPKEVPCHRVVNRDGKLAPGYVFGGPGEKKKRLIVEGIPFKDDNHVDLDECFWSPN
jgi:methylated-DNA-protein-cysteine methyltransferase related protein